jgi:hypothetical protein
MPEYNPLQEEDKTSPAAPAPAPAPPELGDGGIKALNSEREQRKALEKQTKQLEAMLAESKKALEQSQLSLEEKYRQESEAYKQSLLTEAQQAIAERDRKLQEIDEARQMSEQRAALLEQQRAIAAIQTGFSQTFDGLLVNPRKVSAYMAEIADDLTIDQQGNPALILRDRSGEPTGLAPLEQAVGYFQQIYPEDFKPPAEQKTGGGFRNLANTGIPRNGNGQELELPPMGKITPEQFLANRDAIAKGNFKVVK